MKEEQCPGGLGESWPGSSSLFEFLFKLMPKEDRLSHFGISPSGYSGHIEARHIWRPNILLKTSLQAPFSTQLPGHWQPNLDPPQSRKVDFSLIPEPFHLERSKTIANQDIQQIVFPDHLEVKLMIGEFHMGVCIQSSQSTFSLSFLPGSRKSRIIRHLRKNL